ALERHLIEVARITQGDVLDRRVGRRLRAELAGRATTHQKEGNDAGDDVTHGAPRIVKATMPSLMGNARRARVSSRLGESLPRTPRSERRTAALFRKRSSRCSARVRRSRGSPRRVRPVVHWEARATLLLCAAPAADA